MNNEKNKLTFIISIIALVNSMIVTLFYGIFFTLQYIINTAQVYNVIKYSASIYCKMEEFAFALYYIGRLLIPLGISSTVICIVVLAQMCSKDYSKPIKDNIIAVISLFAQIPAWIFVVYFYNVTW